MTRRPPLMEVGCIACKELNRLGAGKEGWLANDPNLFLALDTNSLALANRSFVLVVDWNDSPPVSIQPSLSPSVEGEIAAIQWLTFDDFRVLALWTSNGFLLFYSMNADLIHKQIVHPSRIIRIRVRGSDGNFPQSTSSNEICIVMPGIIARFDGADIQSSQPYYCAVTIGEDAVISAFRLSDDRNRSLVGAILSKVVPATFSTLSSLSKMIWRNNQEADKPKEVKPQAFARASVLTCLRDPPRKGERFALSPSGSLAAVADSLGRILLLDAQALVVVRQWKVWKMRIGPRLLTVQCAKGSKILQPPPKLDSSVSDSSAYTPLEVFLLNGDSGQLSLLRP